MKQLFILCVLAAQFINVNAQNLTKISQFHLVDEKGNRITPLLSSIEDFDDAGNAVYSVGGNANSWGPIKGAKYGIMNNKGRIVLPATYEFLDKFSYDNDSLYKFGKGETRGLINLAGKELIPAMFKYINKILFHHLLSYLRVGYAVNDMYCNLNIMIFWHETLRKIVYFIDNFRP